MLRCTKAVVSQNQTPMTVEDAKRYGNRKRKLLVNERVENQSPMAVEDVKCSGKRKRKLLVNERVENQSPMAVEDVKCSGKRKRKLLVNERVENQSPMAVEDVKCSGKRKKKLLVNERVESPMAVEDVKCSGKGKRKLLVNERVENQSPMAVEDVKCSGKRKKKLLVNERVENQSPMAVEDVKCSGKRKKKLLVNERVENQSPMAVEDVMCSGKRKRKLLVNERVENQSPMAVEDVKCSGKREKKLLVNERVEIRSIEDGFLGSWHQGIVIDWAKQKRRVKYDNIFEEGGSNHLVDVVEVSPVLDGGSSSSFSSADGCNERGLIRPLPPLIEFGVWDLPFGLCVDALYEEAQWEGVIFDHCNGMEERSIFFPDLGDELKIGIHQLRITQVWNEATGNWEPRGKWMLLEVIEECEQFSYIGVSFKQIWFDLRNHKEFDKIRDWTCNVKDLWRDLVREIVGDYFAFLKETPELESVEHTDIVHCDASPSNVLGSKIGISDCPVESGDSTNLIDTDQNGGSIIFLQEKYDTNPLVDGASEKEIVLVEEPESQNERSEKRRRSTSIYWQPLVLSEVEFCPNVINQYGAGCESKMTREGLKTKVRKHLAYLGWKIEWTIHKNCPRQRRYRYKSPNTQDKKVYYSIPQVCSHLKKESNMNSVLSQKHQSRMLSQNVHHPIGASYPVENVAESHTPGGLPIGNTNHKRNTKSKACPPKHKRNGLPTRVQNVNSPCLSHQNVLSWLIESNMVLPTSKVYYRGKGGKNTHDIEGRVTLDGIKCGCCQNVYTPGAFAFHASGCYDCRPCANIFLRDGRSLLDCMIQLMHKNWAEEALEKQCNDLCQGESDNCSVCHDGGELILCDKCPPSFYMECLGLEDIPDGDWFCLSCRCRICNEIKIQGTEDGDFLTCIQCEHKYHIGCLRKRPGDKSRIYLKNWLCGEECEQIYAGIHQLLGKPILVGADNLTWTLVKCVNSESCDVGGTKIDLLAESYSKLNGALSVMHECFEPLKNPYSNRDLMDDVIFGRRSELNRSNFQGFYVVIMERNEELVSVATVRIFGRKVVEVPLVATRFMYRGLGMCRILMDELEKKLMRLGVERIVLPAVPNMLETWTKSFNFVKMTSFERSQFLDYAFLDFPGTVMCQKLLTTLPSQI